MLFASLISTRRLFLHRCVISPWSSPKTSKPLMNLFHHLRWMQKGNWPLFLPRWICISVRNSLIILVADSYFSRIRESRSTMLRDGLLSAAIQWNRLWHQLGDEWKGLHNCLLLWWCQVDSLQDSRRRIQVCILNWIWQSTSVFQWGLHVEDSHCLSNLGRWTAFCGRPVWQVLDRQRNKSASWTDVWYKDNELLHVEVYPVKGRRWRQQSRLIIFVEGKTHWVESPTCIDVQRQGYFGELYEFQCYVHGRLCARLNLLEQVTFNKSRLARRRTSLVCWLHNWRGPSSWTRCKYCRTRIWRRYQVCSPNASWKSRTNSSERLARRTNKEANWSKGVSKCVERNASTSFKHEFVVWSR